MNVIINAPIQGTAFDCENILSIKENVLLLPICGVKDNVYLKPL